MHAIHRRPQNEPSFWTYVLELSIFSPEIVILATWTIQPQETTEDDSHGAAVVTLLQDLARR